MKITKSLAMEVNKSFFIPNNNKQDGNKTLKTNHKHKTVYMTIYLITSSCHSCVAYGNYGVIVLKKYINN
jgi:hypothetical protein